MVELQQLVPALPARYAGRHQLARNRYQADACKHHISSPLQAPAEPAPAADVVKPPGQGVQSGVGAVVFPPLEKVPMAH